MQIYGLVLSQNVFRPLLIAKHLGLDIEVVPIDFQKGEHKTPAYLKLNPHGRMPVLIDGDYALWESEAIVQYLAAKKADPIYPENPQARATILSWGVWAVAHLSRGIGPVQFNRLFKPMFGMGESDEAAVEAGLAMLAPELAVLEDRLADSGAGWLVGDTLTVADYDVGGYLMHAEAAGVPMGPRTADWMSRIKAQPAWAAAYAMA